VSDVGGGLMDRVLAVAVGYANVELGRTVEGLARAPEDTALTGRSSPPTLPTVREPTDFEGGEGALFQDSRTRPGLEDRGLEDGPGEAGLVDLLAFDWLRGRWCCGLGLWDRWGMVFAARLCAPGYEGALGVTGLSGLAGTA